MNYGLYLSAGGTLTSLHKQDVYANNLANVTTVGFKPDAVVIRQRLPERLESNHAYADPRELLERLGGGTWVQPTQIRLTQGTLNRSGSPLDVALEGEGFFAVSVGRPGQAADTRLTRDGRLTMNAQGELVTANGGHRVLDAGGRPIRLDRAAPVEIDAGGRIRQNGDVVAQLQIVSAGDPAQLRKAGGNLMQLPGGAGGQTVPATGSVRQGFVEQSAVDPILTLNSMIGASKAAQMNARMMQFHDHIMGEAINRFGRVA